MHSGKPIENSILKFWFKTAFTLLALIFLSGCITALPHVAPKVRSFEPDISTEFPYQSKFVSVLGSNMHYVDEGKGSTILLVHGNPTSSYLWRNVIPVLSKNNRVIAVDLIGMGKSDKPDIAYRFADHAKYLNAFVNELGLQQLTLVLHDWGGALGLDVAAKNPEKIKQIVLMEALVKPLNWADFNIVERYVFRRFRDPKKGNRLNVDKNFFIESVLEVSAGRTLDEAELNAYRAPFVTPKSRELIAQWPREIPFDKIPQDNYKRMDSNYQWLRSTTFPLLLLQAKPGAIMKQKFIDEIVQEIPRIEVQSVGKGFHYIQETSPKAIGTRISEWMQNN